MISRTTIVGIVLGVFLLAFVLWNIDLGELSRTLSRANYWYVLPAALVTTFGYVLRAARWNRILRPTRVIALRELFPILMIGFMANNVLPARVGEVARAYVLHRHKSVSKTLGLSTIVLERMLDGLTLVVFVGLLSLWFPLPDWGIGVARLAGILFFGGAVVVIVLLTQADLATRLAAQATRHLPNRLAERCEAVVVNGLLGLKALRRRRLVLTLSTFSAMVWLAEAASYFLIIKVFDLPLTPGATILAAIFLLVVVNLGIMLPSAPGYVGTFQAFAILALSAFGVQKETALGVAVVSHGMQYVLVTGLGALFLWHSHLSLAGIKAE